jgi:hypothetical protein
MPKAEHIPQEDVVTPNPDIDYTKVQERAKFHHDNVIKPQQIAQQEDAIDEFIETINTEEELLKRLGKGNTKFIIAYKDFKTEIEIRPMRKDDDFSLLNTDTLQLYNELDDGEKDVVNKIMAGDQLSADESAIMVKLNEKLPSTSTMIFENMHEMLANYVIKPKYTKEQWEEDIIDFGFKVAVYEQVKIRLGIDDRFQPRLFQVQ